MSERRTLYDWFAVSADTYPDLPALEIGAASLTYAELSATASHVAARLLALLGGERPHRVGLLAGRTVLAYAGYLAVQRLGATVVPLGPSFPAERNARIARAAQLDAVIADPGADPPMLDRPVLTLTDAQLSASLSSPPFVLPTDVDRAANARPEQLAYILFTSGSTGVPKGVPIRHRNICAYLHHVVPRYEAGPGARLSQSFDLTFDPSVFDMFTAWGSGATLVVPTRGDLLSPVRFINRRAITHWNSVPSVISIAKRLKALRPGTMPALRRSMFCGEPLTLQQAEAWQRAAPASTVENAYGPTELTVTCTAYRLPAERSQWPKTANGTVPVGTSYPALEIRIQDGELCVRGPQRFSGYLDPANNAGPFLTPEGEPYDPATELTDAHWYRTGDRVRRMPGGDLLHLGRLDQQVQVHGYRVELAEVEAALRAQPGALDAVVTPVTGTDGSIELAAACSAAPGSEEALRKGLQQYLPAYMIPATLTVMEALPLNANGKVDRAAVGDILNQAVSPS
ncbi:AMP-binding protein [Streptomyces sp. RB6PN25]|uniref:AMP-binding protein n=1 Tax=Streptomyces humicola TaxID=2953240 RepID=A0ABT1PTS0_9ACTN|nr:AMP-binding protein [Streptomyces humicola]MCQ4081074.1 AMP-binding protein [Streptomyces humicola]